MFLLRHQLHRAKFVEDPDPAVVAELADRWAAVGDPADRTTLIELLALWVLTLVRSPLHLLDDAESIGLVTLIECLDNWPNKQRDVNDFMAYAAVCVRMRVQDYIDDETVFRRPARRTREAIKDGKDFKPFARVDGDLARRFEQDSEEERDELETIAWKAGRVEDPIMTLDYQDLLWRFTPFERHLYRLRVDLDLDFRMMSDLTGKSEGWLSGKFQRLEEKLNQLLSPAASYYRGFVLPKSA
jgi:hypothetical protein